jgi:hypothetical protein
VVLFARAPLVGVNVATNPFTLKTALPGTSMPPGSWTVKVVVPLIEAASIASLKVALTVAFVATFVANGLGVTDTTIGTGRAIVVNVHV